MTCESLGVMGFPGRNRVLKSLLMFSAVLFYEVRARACQKFRSLSTKLPRYN